MNRNEFFPDLDPVFSSKGRSGQQQTKPAPQIASSRPFKKNSISGPNKNAHLKRKLQM